MKRIAHGLVVGGFAVLRSLPAPGSPAAEIAAFERFADLAVDLPPEVRTGPLPDYSTNRLTFALNNGLAMTPGGSLWASWIAGGDGADSFTVASFSDDRGDTWSDVALVIDGHGSKPTEGSLCGRTNIIGTFWLDPKGRFHVYTDQTLLHFDGRAGIWDAVCADPDAAVTSWSPARRIGHGHVINHPIVLRNGRCAMSGYLNRGNQAFGRGGLLEGVFHALDAERGATCYVSSDDGATWEKRGTAAFPGADWIEPQLLELRDGTLRMFARVHDGCGKLMAADSTDEGKTWTQPFSLASMDNAAARFQIQRLKSGRVLFVKHGKPSAGGKDGQGRTQLTAYLSDDDGRTWLGGLELDGGIGSYPDACQGEDGTVYVTNDNDRDGKAEIFFHRFTEEDVLAGRIVSSVGRLHVLVSRAMSSPVNVKAR